MRRRLCPHYSMENTMIKNASVTDFIILGFSNHPNVNLIMFSAFLCVYIVIVLGNILIIVIIYFDPALHTPMYFFLRNLSFLDLSYISVTLPKMLANLLSDNKTISFASCAVQMFFFLFFGITGCFLLACMAFDRYSAICNPLRYTVIMNKRPICSQLVIGAYICGSMNSMVQTSFTFSLHFCGSKKIDHFFCDVPPLLKLSCTDTYINQMVMFALSSLIIGTTALIILISYAYIICAVLQTRSVAGRHKTFSTCTSHIMVVSIFYGTLAFMYVQPSWLASPDKILYTVFTPLINPLIYSLRNKEVKEALGRALNKCMVFPQIRINSL
uniref:Olfactory receptor n=1 Tax=Pelusios castaneus TaxID=367368 RepID=A0A8C8VFZ1_9SAUR